LAEAPLPPLPLLVLRPQPGCAATLAAAQALGLAAHGHPLSQIVPVAWDAPDPAGIDGLLIGSANVFLHGGAALDALQAKPCHVVGDATAAAARAAGFAVAAVGEGGLQAVLDQIVAPAHLLRIAGEEHIALSPPAGVTITTAIAYRTEALPLDPALPLLARGRAVVLLHSAATARHFAAECQRLGIDRAAIILAALGPRIAAAAGEGWRAVHLAAAPNDAALLELARDVCNEP
jgi:uroporphyrinogen-III synthase